MARLRLAALDRKLLRDLWELRGQALAIAAVVAAGVTMFVTYLSNLDSLQRTRDGYFARQRLADVFAPLVRAPNALADRLAAVPGVAVVDTRVAADVTLDVPGLAEPASGRLVSLPDRGRPLLNDVWLRRGRWITPDRPDEVLASELFAEANGLSPGDTLAAVVNGRRRTLTIVGIALSPEYVYVVRPGEIIPDRRRYGILWMGQAALAAAFDMTGGFNDVSLGLARGASPDAVIDAVDRLLAPYGGLGAIPRRLQISAWTLENELTQLRLFGVVVPAVFLAVAAFILHVALTRALALQRPQIAALKALGYGNRALAWHYTKWAVVIAAGGAAAGVVGGAWLGRAMIGLYNAFFRFPELDYQLSGGVAMAALAGSAVVGALGAQAAVRRAVQVPPAEAMRPEAPLRYQPTLVERLAQRFRMPMTARMVLRGLARQPGRAALSVTGIAMAVAVLVVGLSFIDVMAVLVDDQFGRIMRQDATVSFVQPRGAGAELAVARLPGVIDVEPTRAVPARVRAGHRERTVAVIGTAAAPRLQRVVDRSGRAHRVPGSGLTLSAALGRVLGVAVGDVVVLEVLEGRRPVRRVPVVALVDDTLGLQAYLEIDALHRLLGEGPTTTGAHVTVDARQLPAFYDRVKGVPGVAGVALRDVMLRNFRETMAENMNLSVGFNVAFAAVIALGVVYNAARVALSERARELASLRVLGFSRGEVSAVLLGELAVLAVTALPVGGVIGYALGAAIMTAFDTELYRLSFVARPATMAWAWLAVLAASAVSGLLVRRRVDRLDLVAVLKSRE
ncbi:MAG: ABC transporter permease [Vicinamibacterales bacterium]